MIYRQIYDDTMRFYQWQEEEDLLILSIREEEIQGGGILLTVSGQLNPETACHLCDEVDAYTTLHIPVIVDMQQVLSGSRELMEGLVACQLRIDAMNMGGLTLRNLPMSLYREFDESGIAELLIIEE